jgi:hypothetical protein
MPNYKKGFRIGSPFSFACYQDVKSALVKKILHCRVNFISVIFMIMAKNKKLKQLETLNKDHIVKSIGIKAIIVSLMSFVLSLTLLDLGSKDLGAHPNDIRGGWVDQINLLWQDQSTLNVTVNRSHIYVISNHLFITSARVLSLVSLVSLTLFLVLSLIIMPMVYRNKNKLS